MSRRRKISFLVVLALGLGSAWGQDSSSSQEPGSTPAQPQEPAPAFGADNPAPAGNENPPISGLDLPNLEPHAAPLSYLQAGAHFTEAADSNVADTLGGSGTHSVTRAEGSLVLQRLWSNYDFALDYLGGAGYYNAAHIGFKQIEEMGIHQQITWKRGEFGIRDMFGYEPEGSFGAGYGATGTIGAGLGGESAFFGGTGLGELGQEPRIVNLTLVDVVEGLTPKSSITLTGGYDILHFLGNEPGTNNSFIGSSEISAQGGYDRVLGPHDQGALVYGYQGFQFSDVGISLHSHVIQLMWGHVISGRLNFLVGLGPQFTVLSTYAPVTLTPSLKFPPCTLVSLTVECPESDVRISAAGRVGLRYLFSKGSVSLAYEHFLTNGSGFFAGAESDIVRFNVERQLGRIWTMNTGVGYSRNSRVSQLSPAEQEVCTATASCPGTSSNIYHNAHAGVTFSRNFGRNFHAFATYEFNYLQFDTSFCSATIPAPCNRIAQRQVGTIGVDWRPRPIRLD